MCFQELDSWMMWCYPLLAVELQAGLPTGLRCAHVQMVMLASSVSLAPLVSVMNLQMEVLLLPVFPATATVMLTSVMLRPVR